MSQDLICGNLPQLNVEQSKKAAEFAAELVKRNGNPEEWNNAYCLSGGLQVASPGYKKIAATLEKVNAEQTAAALDAFSQKAPTATALVREMGIVTARVTNHFGPLVKFFGPSAQSAMTPKAPPPARQDSVDALELTARELKNGKIHSVNEFANDCGRNLLTLKGTRELGNAFKIFQSQSFHFSPPQETKKIQE